jgi:hypothetical protein
MASWIARSKVSGRICGWTPPDPGLGQAKPDPGLKVREGGRIVLGFNWSSQHLSALIAAPHQELRLAFSSRASCAALH